MIKYKNCRDDIYYLHEAKTKTGKIKYYFSKKPNGNLAESIPENYEIYENPNGLVFLRPKSKRIILEEEIRTVEDGIKKYSNLKLFKIDIKKNIIIIYEPLQNVEGLRDTLNSITLSSPISNTINYDYLKNIITYCPTMRFILINEKERIFTVERMCYCSDKDDWIALCGSDSLDKLVKKYCYHLGRNSFYNLM